MTTVISHMGLSEKDVTLLSSIFSVLGASTRVNDELVFIREEQQLVDEVNNNTNQHLTFVGTEQRRSPGRLADIIFINADNRVAVETWIALKETNPLTVPIIITSQDNQEPLEKHVIKRPLMLKKLVTVLAEITNTSCKKSLKITNLNVLVVDDSFPVRKYMEHTLPKLASNDFKIEFAASGEEALEKIEKQYYGLIFLDVVMPGMNGYKVCKTIKSKHNCSIVMLTSKKSPFDKVRGTMSGCDAYITKPPKDDQLKKVLDKCLGDINDFYRSKKIGNI